MVIKKANADAATVATGDTLDNRDISQSFLSLRDVDDDKQSLN
jgi:hypothetical protein